MATIRRHGDADRQPDAAVATGGSAATTASPTAASQRQPSWWRSHCGTAHFCGWSVLVCVPKARAGAANCPAVTMPPGCGTRANAPSAARCTCSAGAGAVGTGSDHGSTVRVHRSSEHLADSDAWMRFARAVVYISDTCRKSLQQHDLIEPMSN